MSGTPRVRYVMDHLNHDDLVGEPLLPEAPVDGEAYGRRNESWDRVLRLGGGRLDGALGVPSGSGANPGLQLGAADGTGFSRSVNAIVISVQGSTVFGTFFNTAQFYVPLVMLNNRINNLGDPTAAGDALNLRVGDWRYLRTDIGGITNGLIRFSGINLGVVWDSGSVVYDHQTAGLILRRSEGQATLWTEDQTGLGRQPLLDQATADGRYLQLAAGGIVAGPLQVLTPPAIPTDAANKAYVDQQFSPTPLRTLTYTPNEITITTAPQFFLDINFPMPGGGLRNILVTVDPIFASTEPPGTSTWEVIYATPLILLESPVVAYKIGSTPTGFFRAPAKFSAAVDATAGTIRVQLSVRLVGPGGPLTQVGVAGTMAPNMRTLVTVEDLGPV